MHPTDADSIFSRKEFLVNESKTSCIPTQWVAAQELDSPGCEKSRGFTGRPNPINVPCKDDNLLQCRVVMQRRLIYYDSVSITNATPGSDFCILRRPTQPMQQQSAQHMHPSSGNSAGFMESQLSKLVAEHKRHNHYHTLSSHQHDCRNRLQEMFTSKALAANSTFVLRKEAYGAFSVFNSSAQACKLDVQQHGHIGIASTSTTGNSGAVPQGMLLRNPTRLYRLTMPP